MTGSSSEVSRASSWRLVRRRHRPVMVSASDMGGLLYWLGGGGCWLGRSAAGQREEHVVERGGVHREALDRRAQRVKLVEQGPDLPSGPVGRDAHGEAGRVAADRAAAGGADQGVEPGAPGRDQVQ